MELSLALKEIDLINQESLSDQAINILKPINDKICQAKRIGLKGQIKTLEIQRKLIIAVDVLRQKGFALLSGSRFADWDSEILLGKITPNGEEMLTLQGYSYFKKTKLYKFKGNIPLDVLGQIPEGNLNKAVVFSQAIDPIIAIPAGWLGRKHYWIALWQWD